MNYAAKIESGIIINIASTDGVNLPSGYVECGKHNYKGQITQSNGRPIETEPPGECYYFDNTIGVDAWVSDIDATRDDALNKLSIKRSEIIDLGVVVDDIELQSDDNSYANMGGYVSESIINGLIDVTWKCRCGSRHVYTVEEFKPVFTTITSFRRACFMSEDALATQIENSDDPASIDISTGWPTNILTTI